MPEQPPKLSDIFDKTGDKLMLGGRFSPRIRSEAENRGIKILDFFDFEELKIRNSVLTSEGALSIAMNTLDVSLFGSKSAVIGYGRLGKTLAPMLKNMGSSVTVAARRDTDIAWATAYGFETLKIKLDKDGVSTLKALRQDFDVIFNTVPSWLLDNRVLTGFSQNTLIIDLASAPGGIDPSAAKEAGIKVITALSIPGRYAPVSAGHLIGEYIIEVLEKL
jgi:dipicolinate synthase subunit A